MRAIISLIMLVTAVGLFFVYTDKKYQDIKLTKAKVVELEQALGQSRVILERREDLRKKYNSFKESDRKALENLLPDFIDNVRLVMDMNNIANSDKYKMTLRNIKLSEESAEIAKTSLSAGKKPYGSVSVSFGVTASYENFILFLQDLERSLRVVDVTSLSFKANDSGSYDYNVTLKTYWLNK